MVHHTCSQRKEIHHLKIIIQNLSTIASRATSLSHQLRIGPILCWPAVDRAAAFFWPHVPIQFFTVLVNCPFNGSNRKFAVSLDITVLGCGNAPNLSPLFSVPPTIRIVHFGYHYLPSLNPSSVSPQARICTLREQCTTQIACGGFVCHCLNWRFRARTARAFACDPEVQLLYLLCRLSTSSSCLNSSHFKPVVSGISFSCLPWTRHRF